MSAVPQPTTVPATYFRPRRLGHANIFVRDYAGSQQFYYAIAGIEEVYRQPDNMASFISNGNTYHDFGLTDVTSKYAKPGQQPGLYHVAFELENEVELVEGYNRMVKDGEKFSHTRDHDVAHSLYLRDPDDNMVEIYADVTDDWRTSRTGIIIKKKPDYIPGVTSPPVAKKNYPVDPELRIVKDAVLHARKVTHVALVVRKFEECVDWYTRVVGLDRVVVDAAKGFALLRGAVGVGDLSLLRETPTLRAPGMHHVGLEEWSEANLDRALAPLREKGVEIERDLDHPARRAVTIRDPSGNRLQFFVNRDWRAETIATVSAEDAPYLL